MNVINYSKFACFDYDSVESPLIKLGDVVLKKEKYEGKDISQIGIVIQIHSDREFRTDMFGNACITEIVMATKANVKKYRPDLLEELDVTEIVRRTFFVMTERKRVKGRISFYIGEIVNGQMKLIDNDFTAPARSNHGLINEAVGQLVKLGILYTKHLDGSGYINERVRDYNLIHIESTDLAYVNFR